MEITRRQVEEIYGRARRHVIFTFEKRNWSKIRVKTYISGTTRAVQPRVVTATNCIGKINVKDTFCTKSMRINFKRAWCVTEYQKKEKLSKECGRMEHQSRGRTGVVVFNTWKPTVRIWTTWSVVGIIYVPGGTWQEKKDGFTKCK